MNVQDFNRLFQIEKTEAVLQGVFLADRLTADRYVRLYNLETFYIEVYFDDRTHLIDEIRAFGQTNRLLPYLENVRIAV